MSEKKTPRTEVAKDVLNDSGSKGKLHNLLTFTEHSEKYNKPAKKTKRTDVAKDVLEKKEENVEENTEE